MAACELFFSFAFVTCVLRFHCFCCIVAALPYAYNARKGITRGSDSVLDAFGGDEFRFADGGSKIGSWLRVRSLGKRLLTAMRRHRRGAVRDERASFVSEERDFEQGCESTAECREPRGALLCVVARREKHHLAGFHNDQ